MLIEACMRKKMLFCPDDEAAARSMATYRPLVVVQEMSDSDRFLISL